VGCGPLGQRLRFWRHILATPPPSLLRNAQRTQSVRDTPSFVGEASRAIRVSALASPSPDLLPQSPIAPSEEQQRFALDIMLHVHHPADDDAMVAALVLGVMQAVEGGHGVGQDGRTEAARWSLRSTFTQKPGASRKACRLRALLAMENSTRGGSSETELKELAVMPISPACGCFAVTTVTPVANSPSAPRKRWGSSEPSCEPCVPG
jgi:hypothetical protein